MTCSIIMVLAAMLAGCSTGRGGVTHIPAENALGPYSAAVIADGFVFVSGQIGERGDTFEHEVQTALGNVISQLERAGVTTDDVVAATVYLTDIENYAAFNEIYSLHFGRPYPARAVVAVRGLPGGARVEVQVIARRP